MDNGVNLMKDSAPYVTLGTGGALTQTSATTLQVVGVVITGLGLVMAYFRWKEAKRANDINERRLEHDIAKSKDLPETEEPDDSSQ